MQITACGTYRLRSPLVAPVPDKDLVAPHIVRMLLAVMALVVSSRSVDPLLEWISALKVIGVMGAPAPRTDACIPGDRRTDHKSSAGL